MTWYEIALYIMGLLLVAESYLLVEAVSKAKQQARINANLRRILAERQARYARNEAAYAFTEYALSEEVATLNEKLRQKEILLNQKWSKAKMLVVEESERG